MTAFLLRALPPTIGALSLCGNQSFEAKPKPTSPDTPVHPPKKQRMVKLELRWPHTVLPRKTCCDPSSPSKGPFRERRRTMKYTHMPLFLFPTSVAGDSATQPCSTKGSFETRMGPQWGAHKNLQEPTVLAGEPYMGSRFAGTSFISARAGRGPPL